MEFLKKVLKVSAVVILAVIIIYLIVGLFFVSGNKSSEFNTFGSSFSSGSKASSRSTDELEVNMDKVLINMRSGKYRYMKADMSFRMKDEKNKEKVMKNMPLIRDTILRYSANQDSDEMITPQGKETFKKNLKDIIYEQHGFEVDAIYFRNFVLAQ